MQYELLIAGRHLYGKRRRGFISAIAFISVLGVVIGVAALIVVVGVMTGFIDNYQKIILNTNAHVYLFTYYHNGISKSDSLVAELEKKSEVVEATKFVYSEAIVSNKKLIEAIVVRGVDTERQSRANDLAGKLISGKADFSLIQVGENKFPPLFLGKIIAENIKADVGSIVKLAFPQGKSRAGLAGMTVRKFVVAGILDLGMYEYNSSIVYLTLPDAQDFFDMDDRVTGIEIWVRDIFNANIVSYQIRYELGMPYRTSDWIGLNSGLFAALKFQRWILGIILTLIILVAAFNLVSALIMIVIEKRREIGLLKSMGASNSSILTIFITEGTLIGLVGTSIGALIGVGILALVGRYQIIDLPIEIYQFERIPVTLHSGSLYLIIGFALLISFSATIYPAWRASRLMPVESIRYE
ncbi:MAG: hypothetical protein B6244_11845 [Candidatus Cloacimonetes bacterium 4572_55]|nr:MAG: hypothetical protein B6244_11845 [Candidatus Cloacimonetes bacterium 4572_55]